MALDPFIETSRTGSSTETGRSPVGRVLGVTARGAGILQGDGHVPGFRPLALGPAGQQGQQAPPLGCVHLLLQEGP